MAARTNGAFLLAGFMMIALNLTPDNAWLPFSKFDQTAFATFRDATFCEQQYHLCVKACLAGLYRAMRCGFYDFESFDAEEYRYYEHPLNADMHVVCPKFVAFRGPTKKMREIAPGVFSFTPRHYSEVFKAAGVTAVVRLNESDTYDAAKFERRGFRHHDMHFDDCTTPPGEIIDKFLSVAEEERGKVAVHCTAGLGRTGTLIAIYLMKHYGWSASECIGWLRIVRPGSVIGPQQQFLHEVEQVYRKGASTDATACEPSGARPLVSSLSTTQPPLPQDNLSGGNWNQSAGGERSQRTTSDERAATSARAMGRQVAQAQVERARKLKEKVGSAFSSPRLCLQLAHKS
jgi:cell division cycle 14